MIGISAARTQRRRRVWNLLIGLQIALLLFSLVAPAITLAADPSDEPVASEAATPSADPTPSAEPSAAPEATAEPTPTADPAAEPTAPAPSVTPTDPSSSPDPSIEPPAAPSFSAYIVTFVAGTSAAEQNDALAAAGAIDIDAIAALRMHAVDATTAAADALRGDARVAAVALDRSRAAEAARDDPS
jgi:hypothetical protein